METILGKGAVNVFTGSELTGLDKPGVMLGTHHPGKLTRIVRPLTCTSFSGKTAAGGRLLRRGMTPLTTDAMQGSSVGEGLLPLKPRGNLLRPVNMM